MAKSSDRRGTGPAGEPPASESPVGAAERRTGVRARQDDVKRRRRGLPPLAYLLFAVLVAGTVLLRSSPVMIHMTFLSVFGLAAVIGCVASIRAARQQARSRGTQRPWWFLAGFFVLHLVGGTAIGAGLGIDPANAEMSFPLGFGLSCRLAQVVLLLGVLQSFAAATLNAQARRTLVMDVLTVVGGAAMLLWYVLIGPAYAGQREVGTALTVYNVVMVFSDLASFVGICTVLLRGTIASARRPVALLLIGTAGYLAADLWFVSMQVKANVDMTTLGSELSMLLPLLAIVAAPVEHHRTAGSGTATPVRSGLRAPSSLPYLAIAVGYGVLLTAAIRAGVFPWLGLVTAGIIMTLGVAGRQFIALRENYTMAVTDHLTGIANRVQVQDALARSAANSRRTGLPMAVLAIDLDGFKQINDTYGHEAGDGVLVAFANVLRATVRKTDTAARVGGDEFVVVLDGVEGSAQAQAVAERILAAASHPVSISGKAVDIRASIGIAVSDPAAPEVFTDELAHRADVAMYAAKRQCVPGWQLYHPNMEHRQTPDERLRDDLARAIEAGELRVFYQPIVGLVDGELVAVEALVRWQHPTRGLLAPAEFVPLAEETGLIHDIGMCVLAEASRQVSAWQGRLPQGRRLSLTVNLSASQLERPTLAAEILDVLAHNGFAPENLVVEITESTMLNHELAVEQLQLLRGQRVRVALDDFGTGYSSLRYLVQLPVDVLKLDRCFVAELDGGQDRSAVAEAVVRLGQILHLETVAEGVEQAAQATELTLLGCHSAQGYYFAKPLSAESMAQLVEGSRLAWPHLPATPLSAVSSARR